MSLFDDDAEPDYVLKIVLVGDSAVGKSNLLLRWSKNEFKEQYAETIGVEFATKTLQIDGKLTKVHVWDTAGQERFRVLSPVYYRGAHGALIVYDITSASSFESLDRWIEQVLECTDSDVTFLLIGNKSDLKDMRAVTTDEGIAYGKEKKITFMEASAKEGFHTEEAFDTLIRSIVRKLATAQMKDGKEVETMNGKGIAISASVDDDSEARVKKECC